MIQTVLDEIKASAIATLPAKIDLIAAKYAIALINTFAVYDWWQTEAEAVKLQFPALSVTWARPSKTGLRDAHGGRTASHGIVLSYAFRGIDMAEIQRHMTRIPEAMLLWLDEFPIASRSPGASVVGLANGRDDVLELSHEPVKATGGVLIWAVDMTLPVYAYDAGLPPRSTQ